MSRNAARAKQKPWQSFYATASTPGTRNTKYTLWKRPCFNLQQRMQQFYKTHTKAVIPSSFPNSTTEDNDETEEDATSPRTSSMDVQVPGPSHQPADGTSEEPEEQQRTTPKMPRKQTKPTKSPQKGTHASQMTLQQKAFEIVRIRIRIVYW